MRVRLLAAALAVAVWLSLLPTGGRAQAIPAPVNLRATKSVAECTTYAGGGFAGVACEEAMANNFYILIWDWNGGAIDGFHVYQRSRVRSIGLPPPIQTISQQAQVRFAVLDPKRVGTNGCFIVTAYSGGHDGDQSPQVCLGAANATSSVFRYASLAPSTQMQFYAYHHERTHLNYCNSGSWPAFADGTGAWRSMHTVAGTTDWGMVMSEASWHAGTEPLACPEFFTQALRLGLIFQLPPNLATLQSATLFGQVAPADAQCNYALYRMATQVAVVSQGTSANQPPGGFASAISCPPDAGCWRANVWLYPAGSALATYTTWPAYPGMRPNNDVTAFVKQYGAGFLLQSTGDELGSPAGNTLHHADVGHCQTIIRSIRLNVTYISKGGK
jgi:hypothetical protein